MQLLTADANSPHRQAAPVGVGQAEAPSAELPTEQPILGYQVAEGVTLAALQPTGEHDEEQLEAEPSITSGSLHHGPWREGVDRVVGHYGLKSVVATVHRSVNGLS